MRKQIEGPPVYLLGKVDPEALHLLVKERDTLRTALAEAQKDRERLLGVLKQIQRTGYSDVGDAMMVNAAIDAAMQAGGEI